MPGLPSRSIVRYPMIEASNLGKTFGHIRAVHQVSFQVPRGQVVAFLGANGAGKSTTMRLLTGYLTADTGTAAIHGHDIVRARHEARSAMGYLPEAAGGFPQLTIREFLTFCGESRGLWGRDLDKAMQRVVGMIDLAPVFDRKMVELSKGWRQRSWLGQALLHDPAVLILDEPTDGLDPNQKDNIRQLIREIASEKAIILSTHILEEAEELSDRVIVIADGRIVADEGRTSLVDEKGRLAPAFRRLTAVTLADNG